VARPIGDYRELFQILRRVTDKDAAYGQAEAGWLAVGSAYGWWEETGARIDDTGARRRAVADVTIGLRGRLDIGGADRLRKVGTGEVYRLEGVRKSDRETLCDGFRLTTPTTEPET
jgi:hypothetical protein